VTSTNTWLDAGARFCGGSLKGIRSKLGYLKRLGATAVWVGPLFKQVAALQTYHGYGVQNFLDVDPRFGTREELKEMVAEAHSLGMYVIMDIIL
jgi:glycosidase